MYLGIIDRRCLFKKTKEKVFCSSFWSLLAHQMFMMRVQEMFGFCTRR